MEDVEHINLLAKNRVKPTVLLRIGCSKPNGGAKFAEVLGNIVYDLKHMGCNVRVEDQDLNRPNAMRFSSSMSKQARKGSVRANSALVSSRHPSH